MNRRTFLRTTGVVGLAGASGCSLPFGSSSGAGSGNGTATTGPTSTPELTPTPEPPETRSGAALAGVYPGGNGLAANLSAYSDWLGRKPAVAMVFVDAFGPESTKRGFVEGALTDIWEAGHVPLVSWQPFAQEKQRTSETIERAIATGEYDDQLRTWATLLADWARPRDGETRGRRFYFRPAHEMNGNWFPWSAVDSTRISATPVPRSTEGDDGGENPTAGTPEDYVGMWRRLHDAFAETPLDETDVQWVWAPNADEVGGIRAERYYPGDEYVDWLGLDGFNFGASQSSADWQSSWRSPEQLFDPMLERLRELADKPVALTEFASSSAVSTDAGTEHRPQRKAEWIRDVFGYVAENDIKMTCWFNIDKTGADEADWAVFGGNRGTARATVDGEQYATYEAYKGTVTGPRFLGALPEYPPLLTDAEFAGRF